MNATKTAAIFGCSPQQAESQMRKNLNGLDAMASNARATGKKVNGYSADELDSMAGKVRKGWNL